MNKRQAKKAERKKDLMYDSGQKTYRQARQFYRWLHNDRIPKTIKPQPNYWGEF